MCGFCRMKTGTDALLSVGMTSPEYDVTGIDVFTFKRLQNR